MKTFCIVLFALISILLFPDISLAWGPATHIHLGGAVLKNINILPSAMQALLAGYPYDFIYGSISADIIHGKKFTEYVKHCHNWHIGMKVLEAAKTDSQKSFAYGYLSHLAADVIAHNYYVPNQIIASFTTRLLKHTYWELRFDSYIDKSVWDIARKVAGEMHYDNDPILRETLADTLFSFRTNKRIFNGMLMMGRLKRWHETMDLISKRSQWILRAEDVKNYEKLALDAIFAFLIDGKKARCYRADPAGRKSLHVAKQIRKGLKELKRQGKITPCDYPDIFERLRPQFKKATFEEFGHLNLKDVIRSSELA